MVGGSGELHQPRTCAIVSTMRKKSVANTFSAVSFAALLCGIGCSTTDTAGPGDGGTADATGSGGSSGSGGSTSSSGGTGSGSSGASSTGSSSGGSGSSGSGGSSTGGSSSSSGGSGSRGDAGTDGGGSSACGSATCPAGEYCCDRGCGLCARLGARCVQQCDGGINDASAVGCVTQSANDTSCTDALLPHYYVCARVNPPSECAIVGVTTAANVGACCP
jgi:hypothetical protein